MEGLDKLREFFSHLNNVQDEIIEELWLVFSQERLYMGHAEVNNITIAQFCLWFVCGK